MALMFQENYIQCKCGCKILREENVSTYKKEQTRQGEKIIKALIGKQLVCSDCGEVVVKDAHKLDFINN